VSGVLPTIRSPVQALAATADHNGLRDWALRGPTRSGRPRHFLASGTTGKQGTASGHPLAPADLGARASKTMRLYHPPAAQRYPGRARGHVLGGPLVFATPGGLEDHTGVAAASRVEHDESARKPLADALHFSCPGT
jgi:hypothetical protein